jgi:AAA15 family ATPase/GTPase
MKISYFKIENFRNLSLAECIDPPNLMVICGGNGCGKSAILHAIMAAKEHAAPYGGFNMDPRCVSANAEKARVTLRVKFSEIEKAWYKEKNNGDCPTEDEIILEIKKGGQANVPKKSPFVRSLLSWYSREYIDSPGFFDYIDAHRFVAKKDLSTWNSSSLSDQQSKQSLGSAGTQKFNLVKEYLASLVMKDAQELLAARRNGLESNPDSLQEIREFFNGFFKPMEFIDVRIDTSPFRYIVKTPMGEIDIDDLSSGEKEILNTYVHFHQLKPENAVILFDEIDAHLHPDLERRYLQIFKEMSNSNQIILTTHSPEIMVAAGSQSLFALDKVQGETGINQLSRVTGSEDMHSALSQIMGTNGMVSINRKVVFIEGEESSSDRYIYESLFPPSEHNISFMPAGDSSTNVKTSERINALLSSSGTFQEFYSIVDGDIERQNDIADSKRLFRLPVYHVENYLLDCQKIYDTAKSILLEKCPYGNAKEIESTLKSLLLEDGHLLPYSKAIFDAEVSRAAKSAFDNVYKRDSGALAKMVLPEFAAIKTKAEKFLHEHITNDTWTEKAKGRDLLRAFCGKIGVKYEHFRNLLINSIKEPPASLLEIISKIKGEVSEAQQSSRLVR